jgi:integral membrane protein (TIGR01906 family)
VNALGGRTISLLAGLASAIVIVALAILPFLTPGWVAFEQGRANAAGWTGYSSGELSTATGSILSDLVFGPPDFDVQVRGETVLDPREQDHMRDVRTVFLGLWVLAAASVVVLLAASRRADRAATWRAIRQGALGLAIGVVALGAVAIVAFDALFEAFHEILFSAGSYTFDPATARLVQLFPFQFWQETAIVVGVVIIAGCWLVAVLAGPRAGRVARSMPNTADAADLSAVPEVRP